MATSDERARKIVGLKAEYSVLAPRLSDDECKKMLIHLENIGELPIPEADRKQQKCVDVTFNGTSYFILYVNERFAVMRNE